MSIFYSKLKQQLDSREVTTYALGQLSHGVVTASRLWSIKAGKVRPSDAIIESLAAVKALGLTIEEMTAWRAADDYTLSELERAAQVARGEPAPAAVPAMAPQVEDEGTPCGPLERVLTAHPLPCRGYVTAGALEMVDEPQDVVYFQFYDLTRVSSEMFCLRIRGDSMEPEFRDGGLLVLMPAKTFTPGKSYVCVTSDGRSTFKVYRLDGNGEPLLIPINRNHQVIRVASLNTTIERIYELVQYRYDY